MHYKKYFNPKVWILTFIYNGIYYFTVIFVYKEVSMYIELSTVASVQHTNHDCVEKC